MKTLYKIFLVTVFLTGIMTKTYGQSMQPAKVIIEKNEGPYVNSTNHYGLHMQPAKVLIENNEGSYKLMVNNEPFYIKGAGLEFGAIDALADHNANSFRTWRTDNGEQTGKEVLDKALEKGLYVTMGIEVARERHGFDYNDEKAVQEQFDRIKEEVLELKDHPALLIWAIGNELNLRYTNPKVWDAVNDISNMIHEVDTNHLTTTTLAGIGQSEVTEIQNRANDLDLLSIQMYGDLPELPARIKKYGWTEPYIVSEWGATGHWEVQKTEWGAPIEENSTMKAAKYLERYQKAIAVDKTQCLGSYVFLWGQKQERTPTWYGIFSENGKETESVDVMHYIWNNKWPENRSPQVKSFHLNGKTAYQNIKLIANTSAEATIIINDPENDKITYTWEILPESTELKDGGDLEKKPESIDVKMIKNNNGKLKFETPSKGAYRLFVYASDNSNNVATTNIPFLIE